MRSTRIPALLAAAVLLAGCGGDGGGATADPSSAPTASPTEATKSPPAPDPSAGGAATSSPTSRDGLADLAEEAARLAAQAEAEAEAEQSGTALPSTTALPAADGPVLGGDISWPQCPRGMGIPEKRTLGMPMPLDEAEYVVIGLTNGPGFTPNPCLADQVAWVRERRLMAAAYAVSSFPDAATLAKRGGTGPYDGGSRLGALRNVGHQQARYNLATMERAGLETPVVWVDVEPVPDFEWSGDPVANAAVVEGAVRGYDDAGYRVGVYSTPYLWSQVVGDFALAVPEWRAAGQTSRAEALSRCGSEWSIQGGRAVMGQWVEQRRDQNVTCGNVHLELGRWFHQY